MSNEIIVQTPTPASLIEIAINKGVDTVQLKELMDLQERWEKKEAKKAFMEALSKFQTIVPVINKKKTAKVQTRTGSNFEYKYADLGGIAQSIKEALNQCGLSYRWEFEEVNGKLKCHCLVSHVSGHTETTTMEAGKDNSGAKNDIQQTGSTQTYLQRYSLIGALGLTTAEDDTDASFHKKKDKEQADDDTTWLDQWQQTISQVKSRTELSALYVKNRKVIDANPVIQGWMKTKQDELKASEVPSNNPTTSMP